MPQFQSPHYTQPEAYQPAPPDEIKQHLRNDMVTLWLFLIWPVGLYLMWKRATWSLTTKIIITALLVLFYAIWLIHVFS